MTHPKGSGERNNGNLPRRVVAPWLEAAEAELLADDTVREFLSYYPHEVSSAEGAKRKFY